MGEAESHNLVSSHRRLKGNYWLDSELSMEPRELFGSPGGSGQEKTGKAGWSQGTAYAEACSSERKTHPDIASAWVKRMGLQMR